MSDEHREVPADLITHSSAESQTVTPTPVQTQGGEVAPENMVSQPSYVGENQSAFTPNKSGLIAASIATPAALTGQELVKGGKFIYDKFGNPSLQTYANSQIGNQYNVPLTDLEKEVGFKIQTQPEVQRAVKSIAGSPGNLAKLEPVYQLVNGVPRVVSYTQTPASGPTPGIDLSKYKKTPGYHLKKHGEFPVRAGAASYDIGRAFGEEDPFKRAIDIGGGSAMAAAPFIPKKIGKVPARAIATGLGLVPGAMGAYEAGTSDHADGGLIHLAGGGQPEMGEARAYEPSYNERIYDAISPYIGKQQARGLMGMPGADEASGYNPFSIIAQYPGAVAQDVKDIYGGVKDRDVMGTIGGAGSLAWDAAPLVGKMSKIPAKFLKNRVENLGWEKTINPMIEDAMPLVSKGVKAIKKLLPKGQYENALAESKLPGYAGGKKVVAQKAARMAMESSDITPEVSEKLATLLGTAPKADIPLWEKHGYDPMKMRSQYPDVLPPVLKVDKKKGTEYLSKQNSPEALAVQKARQEAQAKISAGEYNPFFKLEERSYVDPSNYPLPQRTINLTLPKKAETLAEHTAKANSPEAVARLEAAYDAAKDSPKAHLFYGMKQLQDEFVNELGPDAGRAAFKTQFADPMAATTGGQTPNANLMMTALHNYYAGKGQPIPSKGYDIPYPIGGDKLQSNINQSQKLFETGSIDPVLNPKRYNFSSNFLGHSDRPTIDDQMMRLFDPKGTGAPKYFGINEQAVNDLAAKRGVLPVNYQEVAWAGGKGYEGQPMMEEINQMLGRTSMITGEPQKDVLKRFINRQGPMFGIGAVGADQAMNQDEVQPKKKGGKVKKNKKK